MASAVNPTDRLGEAILSTRADAIIAADHDGIVRVWNPGAERMFGYCAAEAVGKSLDLIIPACLRDRHWQSYRQVIATGESRYGDAELLSAPARRADGATISIAFTVVPLRNDGRVVGMAAIMRDVTRRFEEMRALKRKAAGTVGPAT